VATSGALWVAAGDTPGYLLILNVDQCRCGADRSTTCPHNPDWRIGPLLHPFHSRAHILHMSVRYAIVITKFFGVIGATKDCQVKALCSPHPGCANQEIVAGGPAIVYLAKSTSQLGKLLDLGVASHKTRQIAMVICGQRKLTANCTGVSN